MALSFVTYTGVAAQQVYTITFDYLAAAHISVLVDGIAATFSVTGGGTTVTIATPAIVGGEDILVKRTTPKTKAGRVVDFVSGATLTEADLDNSALQNLYISQEAFDANDLSLRLDTPTQTFFDATSKRVKNLLDGTDPQDAASKAQLDAVSVGAGNLPVVGAPDNDKSLYVVGGAWTSRTVAEAQAILNLPPDAETDIDALKKLPQVVVVHYTVTNNSPSSTLVPSTDGTWSELAASLLVPGTLVKSVAANAAGGYAIDAGNKALDLPAGEFLVEFTEMILRNTAGTGLAVDFKITNEVNSGAQVVHYTPPVSWNTDNQNIDAHRTWRTIVTLGAPGKLALRSRANFATADIVFRLGILTVSRLS